MHKYSQKATSFVVMAHYADEGGMVRALTFAAETPIREIFSSLWPKSEVLAGSRFAPTPLRIEILPDESSIPVIEEPSLFATDKAAAA